MNITSKTTKELSETGEAPLPLEVIPNYMGINLCSVAGMTWVKEDDGQLLELVIHFKPQKCGCDCKKEEEKLE